MEQYFISLADSVRAEVKFDMAFEVNLDKFYENDFKSRLIEQRKLYFNLNTNHIKNGSLR